MSEYEGIKKMGTKKISLLDVRTFQEYSDLHLEGALHVPLDQLRDRVHELDSSKNKENGTTN